MQVSQDKLMSDYLPLELASFIVVNKGRAKGGFRWQKNQPMEREVRLLILLGLKQKLLRLLQKVELALLGLERTEQSVSVMSVPSLNRMSKVNSSLQSSLPSVVNRQEESCLITS